MLWKSQFHAENVLPSVWQESWATIKNITEYKEQSVENLREDISKLQMERKQELKQAGFKDLQTKLVGTFLSKWKDSWKSLKRQLKQDRTRIRHQSMSGLIHGDPQP